MSLTAKSVWIFFLLLLLLLIAAAFPTPLIIMLVALLSIGLIIAQAIIILKDDQAHDGEFPYL